MSFRTNSDNLYQVGTIIFAKASPEVSLLIEKYYQRIYYCSVHGNEGAKQLAYFERELLPPQKP